MDKKLKRYRLMQNVCFWLSLASCIVPAVITAFVAFPSAKHTESKLALGGVAVFTVALIVLIVAKSFIQKFITKIPYTLTAFVAMLVILLLLQGLDKVIDDAIIMFLVGVIGSAAGFVLELVSLVFKVMADEIEEES